MQGSGFRVQGAGFRVQGAGCSVQGAGLRVQGAGCRVQGAGCRVQGVGVSVIALACTRHSRDSHGQIKFLEMLGVVCKSLLLDSRGGLPGARRLDTGRGVPCRAGPPPGGTGFRAQGSGLRVQGAGCRV